MNDNLCELIDILTYIDLAPGVIDVYWSSTNICWRIQLDQDDFLREIELWDENTAYGSKYPYELVATYGNVEVFCLVKDIPALLLAREHGITNITAQVGSDEHE